MFSVSDHPKPKSPDIFDNARFEQVSFMGLNQKYDRSPDELIPTLNAIHIRRQNEVWYAANFLVQNNKQIDLVQKFSQITKK